MYYYYEIDQNVALVLWSHKKLYPIPLSWPPVETQYEVNMTAAMYLNWNKSGLWSFGALAEREISIRLIKLKINH